MNFKPYKVKILKEALADDGYTLLHRRSDLPHLMSFIERFDRLGWLPPHDARTADLCLAYGVRAHTFAGNAFYEFCLSGMRNERNPWLTVFFHFCASDRTVRLLAIERTATAYELRETVLRNVCARLDNLLEWLERKELRREE